LIYQHEIVSPANTPATDPSQGEIHVINGVITKFNLMFPPGSAGLLKVQVFWREFQVWPTTPGQYFYGDNYVFDFPENFPVSEQPFVLRIEAYNEDELYSHSAILRLGMTTQLGSLQEYITNVLLPLRSLS
jgi:hypothetical protein